MQMQNSEPIPTKHLIKRLIESENGYEFLKQNYDEFNPMEDSSPLVSNMLYNFEPFYYKNALILKRAYKISSIKRHYNGDKYEPDNFGYVIKWEINMAWEWSYFCKIQYFIHLILANFNCCDRVVNPEKEFKKVFGNITPETWALRDDFHINRDGNEVKLEISFNGHYHS